MKNSYFLGLLSKDSKLQKFFENSLLYSIFAVIVGWCLRLVRRIFRVLGGYDSLCYKYILKPLFGQFHRILGLFLIIMIITPHHYWQNSYALLGAFGIFALFTLKVSLDSKTNFKSIPFPVCLLILAVMVGVLVSPDKGSAVRNALFYFTAIILSLDVMNAIDTNDKLYELMWCLWFALMMTSLYAVYQGIVGVEVDQSLTDTTLNAGMPGRVYSTFENPNNYAELIVMLLPFTAALAFITKNKWLKIGLFASMALPLVAIGLTLSRSGWLALAGAIVVFILVYKPVLIVPMIALGLMAIPFLPDTIKRRASTIGSMSDSSNKYRIYIWEGSMKIIRDYGVTGIGLGPDNFGLIYPSYANLSAINARHAHMLYMQAIIEMGILGFISVMWTVLGTMKESWAALKKKWAQPIHKFTGYALISAMCGMGAMAFVEYIWYYPRVLFVFFTVLGMGFSAVNLVKKEEHHDEQ
ncbi:MAG: O-antigen ligase family protein [Clostridia bacterium]|nr:O-antigen ligase family protein [Clostridia bacterium]